MNTFAIMVRKDGKLEKVRWNALLDQTQRILTSNQSARAKAAVCGGLLALADGIPKVSTLSTLTLTTTRETYEQANQPTYVPRTSTMTKVA